MGLAELTQSRGWKMFMAKLYGIGAAVVIVGALFKIMHWPGAGPMLIAGLGTEAIIFFFSAFEPLHEEDDWSLVFPQLAGLGEEDEIPIDNPQVVQQSQQQAVGSGGEALAKFDEMLEKAGGAELFEKLGTGLANLKDTTAKLSDISDASVATNEYTANVKAAAESVNSLSDSYKNSAETLKNSVSKTSEKLSSSVNNLADAYSENADIVKKSGDDIATSYQSLIDSMSIDFSSVTKSNKNYSNELENLNKNLSALNAVYELQLQSADDSLKKSQEFYGGLDKMMGDIKDSSQESEKYRQEVSKLSKKIVALNTVYGNMLSAMNVKMND